MRNRIQNTDVLPKEQVSILVVDDQPENLELLVQILSTEGYRARPALNAQVALGAVGLTRPELILLDIRMPDMDGFELCRRLKADQSSRDIPVIFISALEDIDEKIKAFQAGGVDYITRPFQKEEVLARVNTHLELSRMQSHLEALVQERTRTLLIRTDELAREVRWRQKTMEKLKEGEENYRFLVENQNDLVIQFDTAHRLIFANPNYCRTFGKSLDDIMGVSFKSVLQEEDRQKVEKSLHELEKAPYATRHQQRALTVDGWRQFEWSSKAHVNDRGEIGSIISVGRDITEKIETEEKLRFAQKMEALGRLAGGIAHDFNNMLSIVIGNTELAMDELPKGHDVQSNLDAIKQASLRAKDVVTQLVDLSHVSDPKRQPIDISIQLRNTMKVIRASLPSTIDIIEKIPPTPQMVQANPDQIRQVVVNLATNAFQAMENRGGLLTIALNPTALEASEDIRQPDLPPGQYVVLTVADTGHGIDSGVREKVFDPYFTTRDVGKGSGMGLAVVHRIVKNHGGAIQLDSTPDKGSTFRIYFPRIDHLPDTLATTKVATIPTGNENILFVDDEQGITKAAHSILSRLGYNVTAINESEEALELFKSDPHQYDLVITDMTMPNMTGDDLSKAILMIRPDIPIIICTGYSDQLDPKKASKIGIRHYADKPLVKQEIAQLIRCALDKRAL